MAKLNELPGYGIVPFEPLERYVGIKSIDASPMTANAWALMQGKEVPSNSDDCNGYLVVYEDGYASWSPDTAFDNAYRKSGAMTYPMALHLVLTGKHLGAVMYRSGWNGKNQFVANLDGGALARGIHACYGDPTGDNNPRVPDALFIFTTAITLQPWSPSSGDSNATDWIVEYRQGGLSNG